LKTQTPTSGSNFTRPNANEPIANICRHRVAKYNCTDKEASALNNCGGS
jgi:hypothetical protein